MNIRLVSLPAFLMSYSSYRVARLDSNLHLFVLVPPILKPSQKPSLDVLRGVKRTNIIKESNGRIL